MNPHPIVVVARDFFSGKVVGADIKSLENGIACRQQLQLDLARDFQLPFQPFLFDQLLMQHYLLDDNGDLRCQHHQHL